MRQSWLLLIVFGLLVLALSVDLPIGQSIWKDYWPQPNMGLDVKGGFRVVLQAEVDRLKPADKTRWFEYYQGQMPSILSRRLVGPAGVREATVRPLGNDRYEVEIPGVSNSQEVLDVIKTTARLEFWFAKNIQTDKEPGRPYKAMAEDQPDGGEVWNFQDTTVPDGKVLHSGSDDFYSMYTTEWDQIVTGSDLQNATPIEGGARGGAQVDLTFDSQGAQKLVDFADMVRGRDEYLAIILDRNVISFPVMHDVGRDGRCQISGGNMTGQKAAKLAALLNAGALPVDLTSLSMKRVEPTIGAHAFDQILLAGIIGFCLIIAFMIIYYRVPGILAVIALCCYVIFCYTVFKLVGVTFSLAGITGFLLSIGMAVDANVLIFERMKEELRTGKTLLSAIDAGFKRAFTAIFDSNACTIITCIVLYELGTGPVQGFAATLGIGVTLSLFTAITLTRMLLYQLVALGVDQPSRFALGWQWLGNRNLHVIRHMAVYFAISLVVLIPGTIFWGLGGVKRNIEFTSGTEVTYEIPKEKPAIHVSNTAIEAMLARAGIPDAAVQLGEGGRELVVRTKLLDHYSAFKGLHQDQRQLKIAQAVAPAGVNADLVTKTLANKRTVQQVADQASFDEVGSTISTETTQHAVWAVLISIGIILFYLSIRFAIEGGWSGVKFGLSAIAATGHDTLVVVSAAAVFGFFLNWEISSLFMTAVLTIIGFSTHDTIVIFDRIRENLRLKKKGETFEELVDRSITQSFARSINTSLTVWFMVLCLLVWGSTQPDLRHFNAIMFIGIVSGAYSSIFNASPILVLIERWHARRGGKTLEAAVKERERKTISAAPKVTAPDAAGYAQTGRGSGEVAPTDGEASEGDGTGDEHRPSAKPKSKKPKRRF